VGVRWGSGTWGFMHLRARKTALVLCLIFSGSLAVPSSVAQTLRDALAQKQLPLAAANLANLEQKITSGGELDDANQFAIAYYLDDGTGMLNPPLYIDRYNRQSATWQSGRLGEATAGSAKMDSDCFGSVLDITTIGERLLLETHINPSAGCILIVSKNLELETELNGWVLGHFDDGTIIYERSQVHFATVHPAEVAVYDEKTKRDFNLFPPKQDSPMRARLASELREFFSTHQGYCQKADDPCDPETFDSELGEKIALDAQEHAVAFAVSYELQGFGQDPQKPAGPSRVIYVYRNVNDEAKVEYRELLPEDIKARFGDVSLQELADPERLKIIFQK
jgi:hypothetical protein